jgi:acetolactate synthase-1/2/3 large subunit
MEALKQEGVDTIFGYPGGAVIPIYDMIYQFPDIKHILVRHEQGAGHMAEGYALATGKVGVCLATSGPGATNLGPALRLSAKIVDSQVTGNLERVASGADNTVENGTGRVSAPITGAVHQDGMLVADWQGYHASGTLSGERGRVVVQGECGPRTATATRVAK